MGVHLWHQKEKLPEVHGVRKNPNDTTTATSKANFPRAKLARSLLQPISCTFSLLFKQKSFTGVSGLSSSLLHPRCLAAVTTSMLPKSFLLCKLVSVGIAKSPVPKNSIFVLRVLFTAWLKDVEKMAKGPVSKLRCLLREENTPTLLRRQPCAKRIQRMTYYCFFPLRRLKPVDLK